MIKSGSAEGSRDYWTYADGDPVRWETGPGATANDRYTFFAYAPYRSNPEGLRGISVVPPDDVVDILGSDAGRPYIKYMVPLASFVQPDLMIASRRENIRPTGNPVTLTMHHALAAVGFRVIGNGEAIHRIYVTGFVDKGVVELDGDNIVWNTKQVAADGSLLSTPAAEAPITTTLHNVNLMSLVASASGEVMAPTGWLMMIPQTLGPEARVNVLFSDGTPEINLSLDTQQWTAGTRVEYTIKVSEPIDPGTPNFTDPQAPYIIYWDGVTETMQVGSWNAVAGGAVTTANQLFFQFGGTVGFLNDPNVAGGNAFASTDIKFNTTAVVDYPNLPSWANYPNNNTTVDGYISTSAYHNEANVLAGYGDPCKLVGLTVEQVKAGGIDNGRFRLPTMAENSPASNWTITGTRPAAGTTDTSYGVTDQAGSFLPASGSRSYDVGTGANVGNGGYYWSNFPPTSGWGNFMRFETNVVVTYGSNARVGYGVRCVGQNLYPVSAAANAGGTAKVTSDTAGANVITEFNEGGGVTFTATPTDGNTEFSRWTLSGAGAAMVNVSASDLSRNPLTVSMPAGDLTATASFVPASFRIGNYVWAGSNVDLPGTFAAGRYDFGRLYQYPSLTSPEGTRGVGWVSTDNPATLASMGTSAGIDMQGNSVAWDASYTRWYIGSSWSSSGGWLAEYDPCPAGWHVPSSAEWQDLMDNTTDARGIQTENGVEGHVFTITSGDTNRIFFLPCTQTRNVNNNGDGSVVNAEFKTTWYWSTSTYGSSYPNYVIAGYTMDTGSPFYKYLAQTPYLNPVRCVRLP